jgi:RNA polymerase sigma-70 factor (ECF subfamily)
MTPPSRWSASTEDGELVDAARRGDRAALEVLLRRHHDRILVLCRRMCRDRGDADDAAQEALVAIVRGLARFDGNSSFSTWSYRVTTNACLDQLRRRGRRPVPSDPTDTHENLAGGSARPGAPDPADAAVSAEQRGSLQRALDQLPDEFRLPVVLRDVADLDYVEIGERLGLPPGTVRSRIARGRAKLAAMLELVDPDDEDRSPIGNRPTPTDVSAQDPP